MKVAVLGCAGRMGLKIIAESLKDPSITLSSGFVRSNSSAFGVDLGTLVNSHPISVTATDEINNALSSCNVAIDFTTPVSTMIFVLACIEHKKPIVIGTTGLTNDQKETIKEASKQVPIVLAPNTSLGITILNNILQQIAPVLKENFDLDILEIHHKNKVDAPSGTALMLGESLGKDVNTHSIRAGSSQTEHTLFAHGAAESLVFKHQTSDHSVFAKGALKAAKWLAHQPPGLYSMADALGLK